MTEKTVKNTPPDLELKGRMAWRVDIDACKASLSEEHRAEDPVVAAWVVMTGEQAVFPYAGVVLSALKPEAVKRIEGATHEILCAWIDPEHTPDLEGVNAILSPINFAGQFAAKTPAEAIARLEHTVGEILVGDLKLDDADAWIARYGDSNLKPATGIEALTEALSGKDSAAMKMLLLLAALGMKPEDMAAARPGTGGMGADQWGATPGCNCPGCQNERKANGHESGTVLAH